MEISKLVIESRKAQQSSLVEARLTLEFLLNQSLPGAPLCSFIVPAEHISKRDTALYRLPNHADRSIVDMLGPNLGDCAWERVLEWGPQAFLVTSRNLSKIPRHYREKQVLLTRSSFESKNAVAGLICEALHRGVTNIFVPHDYGTYARSLASTAGLRAWSSATAAEAKSEGFASDVVMKLQDLQDLEGATLGQKMRNVLLR